MSNLFKAFDVSGSAMAAQSVRLNTIASNMANAQVGSPTAEGAYRSKQPVFQAVMEQVSAGAGAGSSQPSSASVRVVDIVESDAEPRLKYEPHHPQANDEGYVYMPNVNMVDEMANMISASRSYENNVEVMNTTKQLLLRTLQMGQG
ncbi:flagellar basal body rod protein FlgC [Ectothiorhodospira mobilis]|uniref:flagellar basal body rod protein FlgC n=1 Tax=Ectothiorhodospira mobilis TaxID=195064 RepID=UPI0019037784|nr:flagellar basal body rod protein FlgC [Ectothiorhodospira mobilis]MBK1691547.1 flagellar basal body rod protein FlgC [Ectothiorhodospira mobilis]